jgi:hypothetical protein
MSDLNARGFIIDSPNALVKTTSGDYQTITAQSGEVTFNDSTLKIEGGWGKAALTEIDTSSEITVNLTDSMLQFDMMKLTSGGTVEQGSVEFEEFGIKYTIGSAATPTITIDKPIVAGSFRLNGFTETTGSTPTATQFVVTIGSTTTVTFNSANAGLEIYPAYTIMTEATATQLSVKTTDFSKSGSVTLKFPIYADPDADSSDIVAYGNLKIYKAKIKASGGIGGSRKSASTFQVQMTALDPHRADKKWWDFTYNPVA